MNLENPTFLVMGAGTWGLTLAHVLASNDQNVICWDISPELIGELRESGTHPKLPDLKWHPGIALTADLPQAVSAATVAVLVVPSSAMRSACESLQRAGAAGRLQAYVICSKGIERGTQMLLHEVLGDVLGQAAGEATGILSGPSHAEDVANGLPTTVCGAATDPELADSIQRWFHRPTFRVYTHDDMKGVELGGAVKNVVAIASGVSDALGLGDNARAALITRGLAEIVRLGLACGARLETFLGLSGVGDLIVTACSRHSRNYRFGELLARGMAPAEAMKEIGMVVEGYYAAESTWALAQRLEVEMPITEAVYQVLYKGLPAHDALRSLMSRDPKPEHY